MEQYALPHYDANILTDEKEMADYYEQTLGALSDLGVDVGPVEAKAVSNIVMTHVLRVLNEQAISVESFPIEPARLAGLVKLRLTGAISSSAGQELFDTMLTNPSAPEQIAKDHNLLQVSDEAALSPLVDQILAANPGPLAAYLAGKEGLIGFFIGQVMRTFDGSPDPKVVRQLIVEHIETHRS
jgi:aspartyl-tRNA(Asn)/glutamyl-tRNA(Gln) amidotransferase subunit B